MRQDSNSPKAGSMRELFPDAQLEMEMDHLLIEVEATNKLSASFEIGAHSGSITIVLNDGFSLYLEPALLNSEGTHSWVSRAAVSVRGTVPVETKYVFNSMVTLEFPEGYKGKRNGDAQFVVAGHSLHDLVARALERIEFSMKLPLVALPSIHGPLVYRESGKIVRENKEVR